jgi:ABC-type sugar transport system substrate-binding protein
MKKALSILVAGSLVLGLSAVSVSAADTGEDKGKLLFLQTHNNNSFMSYMGEMFVEIAEENGYEVDHLTADSDEATQLSQIEQGVASGQYAGIVCDCTGEGVTQGFKEAKEAGMYVITMHEGVEDNSNVDCVVACSLAETGYEAIKLEVEELGEEFNLAIVNGSEGHGATVAIRKGYDQALEEFTGINVVFDGAGNWNAEDAMALTETWFSSGETIDGIVSMNDGMATGVRQVMKDNGVLGTIPIYSNDCEENTLKAIEAGEQSGSFDMNAEAQCTAAIEAMTKLIDGETLEETEIYVEPLLVTADNLEEYRASHEGDY